VVVVSAQQWPAVEIDPVTRLYALAAAMPWVSLEECVIEAPFARVWSYIEDLPRGVPQFEGNVRRIEILSRDGERLALARPCRAPAVPPLRAPRPGAARCAGDK